MRMCCCRQLIGPLSCTTSCCSQKNLQQYNELQLAVLLPPKVLELLLKSSSYKLHIQWKTASILLKWSLFRVVSLRTMLCVLGTLWSHLHSYTITPGSGSLQPQCDLPATEQLHWGIMLKDTSLVPTHTLLDPGIVLCSLQQMILRFKSTIKPSVSEPFQKKKYL